ncbi:MAG: Hsp20 family protein [Nitrospiraceae bacterium]|nr:Hsp20 family protein [Nitrospiraceae bacterium]
MKRFQHILLQMQATSGPGQWFGQPEGTAWQPLVDIYERPDCLVVVAELPGVAEDDVLVTVEGNLLRIAGSRPKKIPTDTERVHQMEIPHGPFERLLELPHRTDTEAIDAQYEKGYLTVIIPRTVRR